jgi:SAM-dependent methyltransferase
VVADYQDLYSLDFLDNGKEFMYPQRRRVLQDIVDRIVALKDGGTVLDVGCGDGHFLYLCSQQGLICYGVEASRALSSYASHKTGAQVVQGHYNIDMFGEGYFDAITFIQVLEHILTPIDALEAARHHLRPNGILVIEIPSVQSPHFLAYQWTGIKRFVKPPWGVIHTHYGYYTPRSLMTLTEKCGFRRVSLVTGRLQYEHSGFRKQIAKVMDPLLNLMKVGSILYIGAKF